MLETASLLASSDRPQVLVPYNRREAVNLKEAAEIAGCSESTIRGWSVRYFIGRRVVGGKLMVSRVALAMLLDGDRTALEGYLSGDRTGPLVAAYFERAGLSGLLTAA